MENKYWGEKRSKPRFDDYYSYWCRTRLNKLTVLNTQELKAPLLFLLLCAKSCSLRTQNNQFLMPLYYSYFEATSLAGVFDLSRHDSYFYYCVYLQSCVLALLFLFVLNAIYLIYSYSRANFYKSFKINHLVILWWSFGYLLLPRCYLR